MRVATGDTGPDFTFGPLSREDIVRYSGATYDFVPFHHDESYARANGYPTVFAHGPFAFGLLGSFLTRWFGPASVREYGVRFVEQVWPGDVLRGHGRVVEVLEPTSTGGERRARVEVSLLNQHGQAAVRGSAVVALGEDTRPA
jgi:acyl dehydratase